MRRNATTCTEIVGLNNMGQKERDSSHIQSHRAVSRELFYKLQAKNHNLMSDTKSITDRGYKQQQINSV